MTARFCESSSGLRAKASLGLLLLCTPLGACGDADGDNYSANRGDCNDADASINPFALEKCDGIDQDCDGLIDEGTTVSLYADGDGDGYGSGTPIVSCQGASGYVSVPGDCDDHHASINPSKSEVCNELDDNCNGQIDEGVRQTFYLDEDGDGFGSADAPLEGCIPGKGYVDNYSDCSDSNGVVYPFAEEVIAGVDDNCDGIVDNQIVMLAAGSTHSLVLTANGSVWSFGSNASGQLGNGTTNDARAPTLVPGLNRVIAIAAGGAHSLAIRLSEDGETTQLFTWGDNSRGQLGDGTSDSHSSPADLDFPGAISVAAGEAFSLAVMGNLELGEGDVYAWGANDSAQLGDGTLVDRSEPVLLDLTSMAKVAAGEAYGLALGSEGELFTWGLNDFAQLGTGSLELEKLPVELDGLSSVTGMAGGRWTSLATVGEGQLYHWGVTSFDSISGQVVVAYEPELLLDVSGVESVASGSYHLLWLDSSGRVTSLGENADGQLGLGSLSATYTPTVIPGLPLIRCVAAGSSHSLAAGAQGDVWAWGDNSAGQLGDGSTEDRSSPELIATF